MARQNSSDNTALENLKHDLKSGTLGNCYLFHGEEAFLRDSYYTKMKKKLLSGPAEEFNYHRFNSENMNWDDVADAVESIPMMAERSRVEITDINLFKENEEDREKLVSILENIPNYCCLVFLYDAIPYTHDGRLKKLTAAIKKHVQIVEFRRQSPAELRTWIRRLAASHGKEIDASDADYLAFMTDSSMVSIQSELIKLASYTESSAITRQDIDLLVTPTLTAGGFDISNAAADGDYARALEILRDVLTINADPIQILGAVSAQMRRIYYAKVLLENGLGVQDLMEICKMGNYAAKITISSARGLSPQACANMAWLCLEADRQIKSSFDDGERILELLLIRMAQEAKA